LSEATVNVATGYILSESPVEVKLLDGWLNSNRLEVMENGDLIRFGGGVELILTPDKSTSTSTGSVAPSPGAQSSGAPNSGAAGSSSPRTAAQTPPAQRRPVAP
jgi:lipopolysaccharide export system protein LptC